MASKNIILLAVLIGYLNYANAHSISILKKLLGPEVDFDPWNANRYNNEGWAGIYSSNDLNCNFDDQCCWKNAKPNTDQLEYVTGKGEISIELMRKNFRTEQKPSGKFLLAASIYGEHAKFEARLHSCTILCTHDPITVSFRQWRTRGVILQVCQRDAFFDHPEKAPLIACKQATGKPGQKVTITLPPGECIDIVLLARNFIDPGLSIIDDLEVDFKPCPDGPITMKPTLGPLEAYCWIECTYEDGRPCNGSKILDKGDDVGTAEDKQAISVNFEVASGQFGTRVTGIRKAAQGDFYLAANLPAGARAAMELPVKDLEQAVVLRALRYVATDGIQMLGCCDNLKNCPLITQPRVTVMDRNWIYSSFVCPRGTKKIVFGCRNSGTSLGACGIDDIKLFYPDPLDPENLDTAILTRVCDDGTKTEVEGKRKRH